jgi:hypothetical protein
MQKGKVAGFARKEHRLKIYEIATFPISIQK